MGGSGNSVRHEGSGTGRINGHRNKHCSAKSMRVGGTVGPSTTQAQPAGSVKPFLHDPGLVFPGINRNVDHSGSELTTQRNPQKPSQYLGRQEFR
jgi:hypothetical protein